MSSQNDDYEVGYGRPPAHSRFAKGKSGNPKGRPNGAKNLSALVQQELDRKVTVTVDGERRRMSKRELVVRQQVDKAAKGDPKAFATIAKIETDGLAMRSTGLARESEVPDERYEEIVAAWLASRNEEEAA